MRSRKQEDLKSERKKEGGGIKRGNLDDAVEDDVVVVAAARELDEVPAGLGRVLVVHLGIE